MNRTQLEHIIRASAAITGATELVIVGSQSILGQYPDAPPELLRSIEADIFTLRSPDDAELIDGSIGEASPFHQTFGYYAHGVGSETAVLPDGWKDRLVPLRTPATGGGTGLCLDPNDLAISKLVASREKDLEYLRLLFAQGLASAATVRQRIIATPIPESLRARCLRTLESLSRV
jgi:hypothetical protein